MTIQKSSERKFSQFAKSGKDFAYTVVPPQAITCWMSKLHKNEYPPEIYIYIPVHSNIYS